MKRFLALTLGHISNEKMRIRINQLPNEIQKIGQRKLRMLNISQDMVDLRIPPSNRLEKLSGNHDRFYSIRISKDLRIPQTRISEIIKGNRRITADTALRLSKYFGNSAKFWLGIQDDFDIEEGKEMKETELNEIKQLEIENVA